MTTLISPSFYRRLLKTVEEQAADEPVPTWPAGSIQTALSLLRQIRQSAVDGRQALMNKLAGGVEGHSFARAYGEDLPAAEAQIAIVRKLADSLSPAKDPTSQILVAELRLLELDETAYRDLLAEALSKLSEPPRPVDWDRIRASEKAHSDGKTKLFSGL